MNQSSIDLRQQSGFVLVAVLVVVVILSLSAYAFTQSMRLEAKAAEMQLRTTQARLFAESGVELTRALLIHQQHGFRLPEVHDNPELFQNIALFDADDDVHARLRGRFSVVASSHQGAGQNLVAIARFGLSDENSKLDLNVWAARDPGRLRNVLQSALQLPPDLARSIIDRTRGTGGDRPMASPFVSSVRPAGFQFLAPPKGPLESMDDLLQVDGVSRDVLYGDEPREPDATEFGHATGFHQHAPLAETLTIYARASETDHVGRLRIWLNDPDLPSLYRKLESEFGDRLARFVIAYRLFGPAANVPAKIKPETPEQTAGVGRYSFKSATELVGGQVRGTWRGNAVAVASPISPDPAGLREQLPRLLDRLTANSATGSRGTINVNAAPAELLAALPGLSAAKVNRIMGRRVADNFNRADINSRHGLAWLVTEGVLSLDEFRAIEPFVTDRSEVFRVQAFGYYPDRGPWVGIESVVDGSRNPPQLLFYREELGPPPSHVSEAIDRSAPQRTLPDMSDMLLSDLAFRDL